MAAVFVDFTRTPDAHYPQQNNEEKKAAEQEEFEAWKGLSLSTDLDDEQKDDSLKFS